MIRMSIYKMPQDSDSIRYRIKAKKTGMVKYAVVSGCLITTCQNNTKAEVVYQIYKRCRELIRDHLYDYYGNNWRRHENNKQVNKSIISALKRAHLSGLKP